jgi:hypothetical protein
MEKNHDLDRHAGAVSLTVAVIPVALLVAASGGDPEAMSLGVLAALIIVSPFAMLSPTLPRSRAYQLAIGLALAATFILFWAIGAGSLMGTHDEHPADLVYLVVPIVGISGANIARFQPRGMARALFATALTQMLVPAIAVIAGLNVDDQSGLPISMSRLTSFTLIETGPFAALYLVSAGLFRKAVREQLPAGARAEG